MANTLNSAWWDLREEPAIHAQTSDVQNCELIDGYFLYLLVVIIYYASKKTNKIIKVFLSISECMSYILLYNQLPTIQCLKTAHIYCLMFSMGQKSGHGLCE